MENEEKTKEQLMSELATLRQRFTQLESAVVMRKRAEALCATAPGVGQTPELGELLDSILAKVIEAIGADMGLVYLLDMTEKALLLKAHRRVSKYVVSQISSVKLSIEDLRKVPRWQARDMPFSELFGQATLRVITTEMRADQADAVVAVPFSGKGHLNGVMIVASRSRHEFSQDGLQLLGAVAKQMGLGAENTMLLEEVGKLSTSDTLTVVHNQRHFQARLGEELARSARYGVVFSVIMFEIDRFEEYIARSGQTAGDEVIGTMGNVLRDSTRQMDTGCRCDGSKFAVILPHTGPSGAKVVAERMRQSAEGVFKMTSVSTRFNLTISVGIASFPTDELSQEGLVLQADIALSAAKKQGGNQTCLASDVPGIVGTTKSPVTEIIENLQESGASVVYAAAAAVDARNQYTRGHSQNVAKYAAAIGKALELPSRQMRRLHIAALLHDIGKIGVPDTIVEKSEPLDEEEMEIMRKHPELGATIVSQIPDLAQHAPAIRHHHERYDGSGYPSGLKDKDVPLEARIIAVAEAYDNMTMPCPYRQVLSPQEALEELGRRANTQFDPVVVSAFSKVASAGFGA